ncbi:MAG TPA: PH domain-containing protein [Acidimicrobiia bacterium]|jgi:membrane protein YdbS with pleckstrin-like domain
MTFEGTEEPVDVEPVPPVEEPVSDLDGTPAPPPPPTTFERQMLAATVRWVWFTGYLIPSLVVTLVVLQLDLFVLPTRTGLATAIVLVATLGLSMWRTSSRYRNWSWELDETELVIDRGVVFKLTRIVPRVRVQHVDLTSGPVDRFFNLRQVSIYTAGTREADASIPGLTSERAEALRQALITRPPTAP